jgi:hypothetical protein
MLGSIIRQSSSRVTAYTRGPCLGGAAADELWRNVHCLLQARGMKKQANEVTL